jgi:hypothetical protein
MARKNSTRRFTVKMYSPEEFDRTASRMRTWLYDIARKRVSNTVTADDAHTYLDREGVRPLQVRTRLRFINSVLRDTNFAPVGMTPSQRPVAKGRAITEWSI